MRTLNCIAACSTTLYHAYMHAIVGDTISVQALTTIKSTLANVLVYIELAIP